MADGPIEGGCRCGVVRYRIAGAPLVVALCHCTTCRRANAAPVVAWAMFQEGQVVFTGRPPATWTSPAEATRGFCATCGTQISFTATYIPGLIDITVGSLDHPEALAPGLHYWDAERLPWVRFADDLPRHPEFPPFEG